MSDQDEKIKDLYLKQISLSEWFEDIDHPELEKLRVEDNEKRERLRRLNEIIGLPFDRPVKFSSDDVVSRSPEFEKHLQEHGGELCAMRLIPITPGVPKLRMRGYSVERVVREWFPEQKINSPDYRVEFIPHSANNDWSTIFVINQHGTFGEIISGGHYNLTQGLYKENQPIIFESDFESLTLSENNPAAKQHLNELIEKLKVSDQQVQQKLNQELGAEFANDYLCGYFESVHSEYGIWYVDYNRILGQMYSDFKVTTASGTGLSGSVGAPGVFKGRVRIVADPKGVELTSDEILVCDMTTPDYVPLMKQAGAIVTDRGGILCHAAIIARELGKPCLIGTGSATEELNDSDLVTVDADNGEIRYE